MLGSNQMRFAATETVLFGRRAAECIEQVVAAKGAERIFIVASSSLAQNTEEIAAIEKALGSRHAHTFTGITPHVPRSDVVAAANAARECSADMIVTVGGGSVTDAGKIAALLVKLGIDAPEKMEALRINVTDAGEVVNPLAENTNSSAHVPVVCIPTTLSGGEFNPLSGATDEASGHKQGYETREMAPVAVILDPALTVHTPEWLWLSTGVRAMDHCIEALASLQSNDFADGLADNGLRLLADGLDRVKQNPDDATARLKCQIGAWQSMIPIVGGVPMGASHAIGHILGGACNVAHGHTSCVMSPYVLRWNAEHDASRQARIRTALGAGEQSAADAFDEFIRRLGMPRTLTEVGVGEDRFDQIAELTLADIWGRTNPRPIAGADDVKQILQMAR